jgi:ABC-type molybdenum transport system ATPase subunit/photorepair protein PhrA
VRKQIQQNKAAKQPPSAPGSSSKHPASKNTLNIVLDKECFKDGINFPLGWEYEKNAHALVFGSTGTGKTYLVKRILLLIVATIKGRR